MPSELSLTWDDHPKTLLGVFEKLLETSSLVDCTIAAEGQYLKAHKLILSACSPYFQLLFRQENEKNPIVVLKDIKFQELKAMIDFMYRGNVNVPEERLGDFLDAAESLQIKGLGSGNSQKRSPPGSGNGDPNMQSRWSQALPLPCKRQRRTDFQDGLRRLGNVVNFESKTSEDQSNEICVEAPNLCQDETRLSVSSAINSPSSLPSDVSSEMKNFEETKSVSFEKLSLPPCEEVHPNPDSVVVKSELEAVSEVDIQEPDFYIEPKEEDIIEEDEFDATEGETNSEIAASQIPDYSMMLQSTSTRQDTVLLPLALDSTSSMGAVCPSSSAPSDRQMQSESVPALCTAVSDGLGGQSDVLRRHGTSKVQAELPSLSESWEVLTTPKNVDCLRCKHRGVRVYCCGTCEKTFSKKCRLKEHERQHTNERPYICETCGKSFTYKDVLKVHRRVHTGERPFGCKVCGKSFARSSVLQTHLLVHTGERPYSCEKCGKAFARMSVLRMHLRTHSGERPYNCDLCGKSFSQRGNLRTHLRLHSGERRYKCGECAKTFGQKINLQRHLKKCSPHHPH